ncbi:MAG: hypothetical protein R3B96_17905 [Pirellulaceae bacterium]
MQELDGGVEESSKAQYGHPTVPSAVAEAIKNMITTWYLTASTGDIPAIS